MSIAAVSAPRRHQPYIHTTEIDTGDIVSTVTGLSVEEQGDAILHRTVLQFTNVRVTVSDSGQGVGLKIYDFPAGVLNILGAVAKDVNITTRSALASTLNAGVTCNFGLGTTTQANGTLATTEQDIIPTTNIVSSATIDVPGASVDAYLAASAMFDGGGTAKDLYFNLGVAGATDIDGNATVDVNGTFYILWALVGIRA